MLTEVNTKNKQMACNIRKLKQIFERTCVLRKPYLSVAMYYKSRDLHVLRVGPGWNLGEPRI